MTRLSRNIIFNLLGQLLALALSFVAVRFIFRRLGSDALGIIYFTQTVSALAGAAFSLGIGATTVREVAGHHADEPDYVRAWVRTASTLYWAIALLLCAVVWFLAPVLVRHWVNLTTMSEDDAVRALRILGIASLMVLPQRVYGSVLVGLERMDVTNALNVGAQAVRQFGAIAILWSGGSLFDVIWWLAGCHALSLGACAIGVAHLFSRSALMPGFSSAAIGRNLRYALGAMAVTVFATVHLQADKVIVSKLLPLGMLGFYGFASTAAWRGLLLARATSGAAFPSFSALHSTDDREALMSQYRKLQDLVCWSLAPLLALLALAVIPIFTFVFSSEVAQMMQLPVALLCVGVLMNGTLNVPHTLAMASGRPQIAARFNLLAIFVVLPATAALIYKLGLTGAGLSWVWYHVVAYAYAVPQVCRQCCDFSVWVWYKHIAKVFGAIAVTYGAAWGVLLWLGVDSIPVLAVVYIVATIAYGVLAYFAIGPELRATMRAHASRFFGYLRRSGRGTSGQE